MGVQTMLDNAATASQVSQLLEPGTRGAILRAIAQWIEQTGYHHVSGLLDDLKEDAEFDK